MLLLFSKLRTDAVFSYSPYDNRVQGASRLSLSSEARPPSDFALLTVPTGNAITSTEALR